MNYLIIKTHQGSNYELIEQYLKEDKKNIFYRFIDASKYEDFIKQYTEDLNNGLIINPIQDYLLNEINWEKFCENIIENTRNIYDYESNKNHYIVFITNDFYYTAKNPDKTNINVKYIWLTRNPFTSWTLKDNFETPKKLTYQGKMLLYKYEEEILKWAEESIDGFKKDELPIFWKKFLRGLDISIFIPAFFIFLLMFSKKTTYTPNNNDIDEQLINNLVAELAIKVPFSTLASVLNSENIISLDSFNYTNIDDVFSDSNIFEKCGKLTQIITKFNSLTNQENRNTLLKMVQNIVYVALRINDDFPEINNQNFNFMGITTDDVEYFFTILSKINFIDLFTSKESRMNLVALSASSPTEITSFKNNSEEYRYGLSSTINNKTKDVETIIKNYAENNESFNLDDIIKTFSQGFNNGFYDGKNGFEKLPDDEIEKFGYIIGSKGGQIYAKSSEKNQIQTINYYEGIKDGYIYLFEYNFENLFNNTKYIQRMNVLLTSQRANFQNTYMNAIETYMWEFMKKKPTDKFFFTEELIHNKPVETWNTLFRFLYEAFFQEYADIPEFSNSNLTNKINFSNKSLAFLDLKIFLGSEQLPNTINFKKYGFFINKEDFIKNIPFHNYIYDWNSIPFYENNQLVDEDKENEYFSSTSELIKQYAGYEFNTSYYENLKSREEYNNLFENNRKINAKLITNTPLKIYQLDRSGFKVKESYKTTEATGMTKWTNIEMNINKNYIYSNLIFFRLEISKEKFERFKINGFSLNINDKQHILELYTFPDKLEDVSSKYLAEFTKTNSNDPTPIFYGYTKDPLMRYFTTWLAFNASNLSIK